jgi:hypothetical protein
MQPYLFPYLGYFQLIHAVDRFVLLDDAAYSKGGWINRNVLAAHDRTQPFAFPVARPRLGQRIDDVRLADPARSIARFLKTLQSLYGGAPRFGEVMPLLRRVLAAEDDRLAALIARSLDEICRYLGIGTPLCFSATRHAALTSRKSERVIDICRAEGATVYINSEGGQELYRPSDFAEAGIELRFLRHRPTPYDRSGGAFFERLSIIDVMMFNSPAALAVLLGAYDLVEGEG